MTDVHLTSYSSDPDFGYPDDIANFISQKINLDKKALPILLESASQLQMKIDESPDKNKSGVEQCIINRQPLNDIQHLNLFLQVANESLKIEGYLVGNVETYALRKQALFARFMWPFNRVVHFFDYWINRVWPKLPYLKKIYFLLTGDRNRVLTEIETIGRLYAAGFCLEGTFVESGRLYFVARKISSPDYTANFSSDPVIKLTRVGQDGKLIKVYKLRTMFAYSEYLQKYIYEQNGLQNGGKIKDDPRINRTGRFLRRYWIDELPMLINLFKGELKIFGVRPISPHYLSLYPPEFQERRKRLKPGLIPPLYAEVPETMEDIVAIEKRYMDAYERRPWITDIRYTCKALFNIFFKGVRSH